uniref:CAZy families GH3 protein n=1 Tax=uncultured Caulobacter sp. TaxID=158749 RepID=A0A060BYV8_9CAUL|nr:CAZy families GH3 protein [uncultured Caulobacter sp.]
MRELKGFQRVTLAPGGTQRVRFTLKRQDLQFWGGHGWTVEPGSFDLWIATSSVGGLHGSFDLARA